jgi:choline dehydrogenase-like flavoprotein
MRTATVAFGGFLAEQGIGRLKLRPWLLEPDPRLPDLDSGEGMIAGRQHMCTTRMSLDPATGVVDTDCRVHGIANLYLGGSSVFPTPGFPKPTFTIVQLALRLGDHISGRLSL